MDTGNPGTGSHFICASEVLLERKSQWFVSRKPRTILVCNCCCFAFFKLLFLTWRAQESFTEVRYNFQNKGGNLFVTALLTIALSANPLSFSCNPKHFIESIATHRPFCLSPQSQTAAARDTQAQRHAAQQPRREGEDGAPVSPAAWPAVPGKLGESQRREPHGAVLNCCAFGVISDLIQAL